MKKPFTFAWKLAFAASFCIGTAGVFAQDAYPTRPIKFIIPFAPGGASDVLARSIGEVMGQRLKQPVIVESRTGAGGMIAANACKSAPPDGYTYCLLLSDILVIHPYVYKKISYDVAKDFVPVVSLVTVDSVLVGSGKSPAKDFADLVRRAKQEGRSLNWGTYGTGSSAHLLLEQANKSLDTNIVQVPYQGGAPANAAVLAGQTDLSLSGYGIISQYIANGAVKPLAVVGKKRLPQLPDTPTLSEEGVDFKSELWQALFAPRNTPANAVRLVNETINDILRNPEFVAKSLTPGGYTVTGGTPAELEATVRQDAQAWGTLAKSLNLQLD